MNLQVLLGLYQNDIRLKQIAAGISLPDPKVRVYLENLRGSSINFIAATIWQLADVNHVFILNDKEEAAYFHNDLEQLTGALDICFFPDSFKRPGNFADLNSSHVMLRTEALTKFNGNVRKKVLVTYPEALFEKVVNPTALSGNMIGIKVGESLQVDALLEKFVGLGFKREDFVYEPGQFAMRGGILDIYSFGNEHPYRIELFGDEVDSIRIFNPETQLSERKLLQVSILPNIETNFDTQEKISLLDYLPENTVIWAKDLDFTIGKIGKMEMDLPDKVKIGQVAIDHEEEWLKEFTKDDFETCEGWTEQVKKRHLIEWYNHSLERITGDEITTVLQFATDEQPVFNRQFNMLIEDLKKRSTDQYVPYIFAENPKQLERLRSVFEDLDAQLNFVPIPSSISKGFIDHEKKALCYTDHQIFQRYHKYKVKQAYTKGKAITIRALKELQPGDYVTHIDHGVGVYSGLQKIEVNGAMQEAVRIIYRDNDVLYVNINSLHKISKYTGKEGTKPKVNKLGSDAWEKLKNKTKKQVKDIATDLIKLYAKRKASQGFAHTPDSYLQTELEASFFYEDTPDQSKATADVKRDMESPSPMDRLVCGDVGFGKTEVAIRSAFKTVGDSKQAAVLVPTTILAFQHYQTFKERLKDFPCTVDYVNRFKSAKEKKETLKKVEEGKVDIIIGTHALLSKDVKFKDLGILIIDEEQKFGVSAKEKLRELRANVDTLTLTATPIPRTLQFSLMNARDLSIINTPPPNRQPVHTEVLSFDEYAIRDAIYYETERGGQVYFIHNRVQSLPEMVTLLRNLCPDLEIGMAHGQMEGHKLEEALFNFIERQYDVLCCTNIVESGVDIPNANTIIINNAHQFGLSDLHQLRGRVGRSNKKAFCYLMAPAMSTLPNDSRKRLQTLEQFNELGSGFQIAMRDLDIRGAGNLLGGEQSGFISEIGFEMYHKILDEAIRELKTTDFKDVFSEELARKQDYVNDCTIDTDLEILIPDSYVESITERLSLYTQLDNIENEEELQMFAEEFRDRFGPIPPQVEELFTTIRCRRMACELGFEKLILKNEQLRFYFINNPDSPYFESEIFNHILAYIQRRTNNARLKQVGKNFLLIVDNVKNMSAVQNFLDGIIRSKPQSEQ
ncbi:transcription-repair coupling factor [Polluticoccus soli]|uniref:transcription-repair coupling factor n=1 Tax=Polluticoccus soli TaxID=3034150 RepID=UPI0023E34410|nr:transcription-repair coupling factor [Flavipsychrobacter sp. JY13-12]